jgi:putative transcriptional regulator
MRGEWEMKNSNSRDWLVKIRGNRTQQQVAELAGVSRNYYTEIEKGAKTPSVEVAQRIGIVMSFDWTLFFGGDCRKTRRKQGVKREAI